ncbi:YheC/YheD family protein [Bacillus dakarensis]|uniref:YheC/YheD family endospore coat-associated protein n=1 Tax=Robertmurraya dakarensis TaxID=1926278 RepID=UPI00098181D5|nr:YheC/YheD family protein [Bacillus dakarensis]
MNCIGFLTLHLRNEETYFTEIALRAKKFGFRCYRFIPSNITPETEMVEGEAFDAENHVWRKEQFPIPNILYDRCFYNSDFHSTRCMAIVNWLKSKDNIQFLGFGLPNKLELHRILSKTKLAPYLPPTKMADSPSAILKELQKTKKIILKPIHGSQGNGIYLLEFKQKSVTVRTDKKDKQISYTFKEETRLQAWLTRILGKREFLIQPYLHLTNHLHQPFDIRSLLQKNARGQWKIIGKGVRVGSENRIISNLSGGASVLNYDIWLEAQGKSANYVRNEIDEILHALPLILETHFPPLFELGVDIGLARDGSLWILDINSKPGRKVLLIDQPEKTDDLYEAPLQYAKSLTERSSI